MNTDNIRLIKELIGKKLNSDETKLWLEEGKIKVGDIIEFRHEGKIMKERVARVILYNSIYDPGVVVELINNEVPRKHYIRYDNIIVKINSARKFNGNRRRLNLD